MYYILHGNVHVYHRPVRSNSDGLAQMRRSQAKQVEGAAAAAAALTREQRTSAQPSANNAPGGSGSGRSRHRRSAIRGSVVTEPVQVAEVSQDTGLFVGYLPAGAPLGFCSS